MKSAEVSTPSETEVLVQRSFAAPVQLVWQAYTEPDLMHRWLLGPPGWSMPICEMDAHVGGKYRWRWGDEDGQEFGFHGEFQKVTPHSKLVHTEYYDPGDLGAAKPIGAAAPVLQTMILPGSIWNDSYCGESSLLFTQTHLKPVSVCRS